MLAIAHRSGSTLALITAQLAQAFPRHILGDLAGARELYRKVRAYYREDAFREAMVDDEPRAVARIARASGRSPHELAAIYNWCTEGFDTRDLIDAEALLDELD